MSNHHSSNHRASDDSASDDSANSQQINKEKHALFLLSKLPEELQRYIRQFIPLKTFLWVDKKSYINYHHIISKYIKRYDSYVRDIIRNDNYFVFSFIMREKFPKWILNKKYNYKNTIYTNYIRFLVHFCNENQSTNCANIIKDYLV